jgi:drug/metabolite transporter (DMT)-like permease
VKRHLATGLIDIHLAVLLFGFAGLFGKFLVLPAWLIVLGRTGFATLALGIRVILSKDRRHPQRPQTMVRFSLLGVVLATHWITFFHAIQVSSVAVGLLAFSTFPVFITGLEPWWFKERYRRFDLLTALSVVLGLVIMISPGSASNGGRIVAGVMWGTISGFTFAILSLLNRQWVRDYPPAVIALYQNGTAALLLLPMMVTVDIAIGPKEIGLLIVLGVLCTALSHALFIRGLATVRAQLAAIIACLEPVYGIVFAGVLLGEIPRASTIAGGTLILLTTTFAMIRRESV